MAMLAVVVIMYTRFHDLLFMCLLFRAMDFKRITGAEVPRSMLKYWFCNCSK